MKEKEYIDLPSSGDILRICDLDESDKPREKAISHGLSVLTNAELMAIILGSGMQGKSVLTLSREILRDNNNRLPRIGSMTVEEMSRKYHGIGPAKAVTLLAAFELGTRCQREMAINDPVITGSRSVYDYLRGQLERLPYEEFHILHLSRANRIMFDHCVSRGGTSATIVDIKLAMKRAIDNLASGLILVHNHPSGTLQPSPEDDKITRRLKEASAFFDIRVLDHIIISANGFYSYNDEGRL